MGTTLRTTAAIDQARLARTRGFATEMIFVATDSVDESIARILQRAQGGRLDGAMVGSAARGNVTRRPD